MKVTKAFRAAVEALTPESKMSPCCSAALAWEGIGGCRTYRVADGLRTYKAQCAKCHIEFTIIGDLAF